jgi:hypothetical protein
MHSTWLSIRFAPLFKNKKQTMKKTVFILLLVVIAGASSYAQCDKKVLLTSNLTEYLNSEGELQRSVDEVTTVEYDAKSISISPGGRTMEGTINSSTCEWKVPFKEGKSVIKLSFVRSSGETENMTVTIEGKNGKISLIADMESSPERRIRIAVEKFEEKK